MKERSTIQKRLILDAVKHGDHPTADDVYVSVSRGYPSISRGTVYRNLGIMADNGDIMRIEMPNAPDRFDGNPEEHYHFSCSKCGKMFDMKAPYSFDICKIADDGFQVDSYDLIFKGVCSGCLV